VDVLGVELGEVTAEELFAYSAAMLGGCPGRRGIS